MNESDEVNADPLTHTMIDGDLTGTQTLRVIRDTNQSPAVVTSTPAPIDPGEIYRGSQGQLQLADANTDLLVLSAQVHPSEVEALAVTLWDDAGWQAPGVLQLHADVSLRGPYQIDSACRQNLKLPSWAKTAFVWDAPTQPTQPIPAELVTSHPLVQAYRDHQPSAYRWEILNGLYAIARRLAGGWRIGKTGKLLQPDPDSAVSLTLYTPKWLDRDALATLITHTVSGTQIVSDIHPQSRGNRRGPRRDETAAKEYTISQLGAEEFARISAEARAFDEMALANPQQFCGYSLIVTAGHHSHILVTAEPVNTAPAALRWETWARERLGEITLSWLPAHESNRSATLTRSQRIERLRVAETIETLAVAVNHLLGGAIVDEDGFLVAVDQ